jgi:hypothetical protein
MDDLTVNQTVLRNPPPRNGFRGCVRVLCGSRATLPPPRTVRLGSIVGSRASLRFADSYPRIAPHQRPSACVLAQDARCGESCLAARLDSPSSKASLALGDVGVSANLIARRTEPPAARSDHPQGRHPTPTGSWYAPSGARVSRLETLPGLSDIGADGSRPNLLGDQPAFQFIFDRLRRSRPRLCSRLARQAMWYRSESRPLTSAPPGWPRLSDRGHRQSRHQRRGRITTPPTAPSSAH